MATINQRSQSKSGVVSSFSITPASVSVGDLVVIGLYYSDDVTSASINDATNGANKDSLGNTYVTAAVTAGSANPVDLSTDGDKLYLFYSIVTAAGTPTIRFLASSGSHTFWVLWALGTPTNAWTLDQTVTSGYNVSNATLSGGAQTPTTSAGYAFCAFASIGTVAGFTPTSPFTTRSESADSLAIFMDDLYASTTTLTATATITTPCEHAGILALFKDAAGGGPTTKSDTDTGTLAESATALANTTVGQGDTATLGEQVPQIAPTAQTDGFSFSETQTVTPSSAVSKTDTDPATLAEQVPGITLGTQPEVSALSETSISLVVTDVTVPDFTVAEQIPRIGLSPADLLSFSEIETLTASMIRFVDTDALTLGETWTLTAHLAQTDTGTLGEFAPRIQVAPVDTFGLAESNAITAILHDLETGTISDAQAVTVIGGYVGYATAVLLVQDRLLGTASATARLAAALSATDRLGSRLTVQPVGPP